MTRKGGQSFGFSSTGCVYYLKQKVFDIPGFVKGNTVGCGINFFKNEAFFTVNGELLKDHQLKQEKMHEYYTTVSLGAKGDTVLLNFGATDFLYDCKEIELMEKKWGIKEISKQTIDNIQIYNMVLSYLYQNGFKNTQICFESTAQQTHSKINLPKQTKFCDNGNESICLDKAEQLKDLRIDNSQMMEEKPDIILGGSLNSNRSDIIDDERCIDTKKSCLFNRMSSGLKNIFRNSGQSPPYMKTGDSPDSNDKIFDSDTEMYYFLVVDLIRLFFEEFNHRKYNSYDKLASQSPTKCIFYYNKKIWIGTSFLPQSDVTGFDERAAIRKTIMEKNCEQAEEILLNFYTNFLRSEKGEEVVLRLRVQKFLDLIKVNPIEAIQLARERFSNVKEHTIKLISDNNKQVKYKIKVYLFFL